MLIASVMCSITTLRLVGIPMLIFNQEVVFNNLKQQGNHQSKTKYILQALAWQYHGNVTLALDLFMSQKQRNFFLN